MLILVIAIATFSNVSYGKAIEKPISEEEIQNFVNAYMESEMKKQHIAGAAVVVVQDQKELFKKGYGYSDIEHRVAVEPDVTTFPIASVSKLFTATAIMQLYSEGKIDLNKNVESYIEPLKVDNPYKGDVTCANLLTHSSGMDEASELLGATKDVQAIKSQETYFKNHSLKLVEKPNTVSRYSNLGYNLLGYIVERVSGISYEDYVEEHIFKPLGMVHSSVRLQDEHMASGYMYMENEYIKVPFAYQYTSGSAGVIATASDMGCFMNMQLNKGSFARKTILKANAQQMMRQKMFSNDQALPGMGYGFVRSERNGQEIIKHEGALPGYMSTMILLPEQDLGIFVTVNTFAPLPFQFEEAFLNHFFPQGQVQKPTTTVKDDVKRYVGTYRNYDGMAQSNIMMCGIPFETSTDLVIQDNGDGTLQLKEYTQAREQISTTLYEVSEGQFIRVDGRGDFAFRIDEKGHVTYAFNDVSHNAYARIPWYEEKGILLGIMSIGIVLLLVDIGGTIGVLVSRKNKKISWERKMLGCNIIGNLCTMVGSIGAVYVIQLMVMNYDYSLIPVLYGLLTSILIGCAWTIVRLVMFFKSIIKARKLTREISYSGCMVSTSLLYMGVLQYCQLIGYHIS